LVQSTIAHQNTKWISSNEFNDSIFIRLAKVIIYEQTGSRFLSYGRGIAVLGYSFDARNKAADGGSASVKVADLGILKQCFYDFFDRTLADQFATYHYAITDIASQDQRPASSQFRWKQFMVDIRLAFLFVNVDPFIHHNAEFLTLQIQFSKQTWSTDLVAV
jgi:hypothetical protein